MRIVHFSDTHNQHENLEMPEGDLLLHTGDFTNGGKYAEVLAFALWLSRQPHKYKVVIAGNHDMCLDPLMHPEIFQEAEALFTDLGITYLRDNEVTIEGIRIYGSPYQPWFHDWGFNLSRGAALKEKWARSQRG